MNLLQFKHFLTYYITASNGMVANNQLEMQPTAQVYTQM